MSNQTMDWLDEAIKVQNDSHTVSDKHYYSAPSPIIHRAGGTVSTKTTNTKSKANTKPTQALTSQSASPTSTDNWVKPLIDNPYKIGAVGSTITTMLGLAWVYQLKQQIHELEDKITENKEEFKSIVNSKDTEIKLLIEQMKSFVDALQAKLDIDAGKSEYSQLPGQAVDIVQQLDEGKLKQSKVQQFIIKCNSDILQINNTIIFLQKEKVAQSQTINGQKQENEEKQTKILKLEKVIEEKEQELKSKKEEIHAATQIIEEVKKQCEALQQRLTVMTNVIQQIHDKSKENRDTLLKVFKGDNMNEIKNDGEEFDLLAEGNLSFEMTIAFANVLQEYSKNLSQLEESQQFNLELNGAKHKALEELKICVKKINEYGVYLIIKVFQKVELHAKNIVGFIKCMMEIMKKPQKNNTDNKQVLAELENMLPGENFDGIKSKTDIVVNKDQLNSYLQPLKQIINCSMTIHKTVQSLFTNDQTTPDYQSDIGVIKTNLNQFTKDVRSWADNDHSSSRFKSIARECLKEIESHEFQNNQKPDAISEKLAKHCSIVSDELFKDFMNIKENITNQVKILVRFKPVKQKKNQLVSILPEISVNEDNTISVNCQSNAYKRYMNPTIQKKDDAQLSNDISKLMMINELKEPVEFVVTSAASVMDEKTVTNAPLESKSKPYGPFYAVFDTATTNAELLTGKKINSSKMAQGLQTSAEEISKGGHLLISGYGYSGSGKTYSLLGNYENNETTSGLFGHILSHLSKMDTKPTQIEIVNYFEHMLDEGGVDEKGNIILRPVIRDWLPESDVCKSLNSENVINSKNCHEILKQKYIYGMYISFKSLVLPEDQTAASFFRPIMIDPSEAYKKNITYFDDCFIFTEKVNKETQVDINIFTEYFENAMKYSKVFDITQLDKEIAEATLNYKSDVNKYKTLHGLVTKRNLLICQEHKDMYYFVHPGMFKNDPKYPIKQDLNGISESDKKLLYKWSDFTGVQKYLFGKSEDLKFDSDFDRIEALLVDKNNIITAFRENKMTGFYPTSVKTENNDNSSRSHLFITLKISYNERKPGYLTIVDMGGRENAATTMTSLFTTTPEQGKDIHKQTESMLIDEMVKLFVKVDLHFEFSTTVFAKVVDSAYSFERSEKDSPVVVMLPRLRIENKISVLKNIYTNKSTKPSNENVSETESKDETRYDDHTIKIVDHSELFKRASDYNGNNTSVSQKTFKNIAAEDDARDQTISIICEMKTPSNSSEPTMHWSFDEAVLKYLQNCRRNVIESIFINETLNHMQYFYRLRMYGPDNITHPGHDGSLENYKSSTCVYDPSNDSTVMTMKLMQLIENIGSPPTNSMKSSANTTNQSLAPTIKHTIVCACPVDMYISQTSSTEEMAQKCKVVQETLKFVSDISSMATE